MKLSGLAFFTGVFATSLFGAVPSFELPEGGWAYTYSGDQAAGVSAPGGASLDGTWRNDNGSDEWDGLGRGVGVGQPGGVSTENGVLTIEDAVDFNAGFEPSNRKIYFTHNVANEGITAGDFIDQGVTLYFRTRLTPSSEELSTPNGYGIFSGGKGNFGVRQSGLTGPDEAIISFSLVNATEDPGNQLDFGLAGLTMNRLNGDVPSGNVNSDSPDGIMNLLPLDPTQYHEFWITILRNDSTVGNGTHTVNIYMDGNEIPTMFNVTAGNGDEGSGFPNFIAMGANNTASVGAFDVDFYSYKPGIFTPVTVPEPATWVLLGLGGLFLGCRRFARK